MGSGSSQGLGYVKVKHSLNTIGFTLCFPDHSEHELVAPSKTEVLKWLRVVGFRTPSSYTCKSVAEVGIYDETVFFSTIYYNKITIQVYPLMSSFFLV